MMPMDNNPSFFKVMIGDFRAVLRIPPKFKKHLSDNAPKIPVLRTAGGRKWRVKMGAEEGNVLFRRGWARFVSDNNISNGDFLVFSYDGNAGFDVKLYDTTCCEKEECRPHPVETVKIESESESSDSDDEEPIAKSFLKPNRKRKMAPFAKGANVRRSRPKTSNQCYKVLRGAKPAENEKAMRAACAFRSPHPHFVTTCRHARTTYMTIPIELTKEFSLDQKESIILHDPLGASWSVKLSNWRDGRQCLSSGWSDLYKKNSLKQGDVCVLEFVQGGEIANVHIFRAENYGAKASPESGAATSPDSHEKLTPTSDERPLPEDDKERVTRVRPLESNLRKFTVIWRPTRLYHVPIPKKVATAVGINSNQQTSISDPSGRLWPVNITVRSYGQVELGVGWSSFSRGNKLALGDVCLFEILGEGETINVHITRAAEPNINAAASDIQLAQKSETPPS